MRNNNFPSPPPDPLHLPSLPSGMEDFSFYLIFLPKNSSDILSIFLFTSLSLSLFLCKLSLSAIFLLDDNLPEDGNDSNLENEFRTDRSEFSSSLHRISTENESLRQELALSRKSLSELQQRQRILLQR